MKIARCKQVNKESKNAEPTRVLPLLLLLHLFRERTCDENIWALLKGADGRNEKILCAEVCNFIRHLEPLA